MLVYFLRRLALTIPTFIALMFVTFVAIRLVPGDPVEVRVGEHGISPERLAYFRHQLGLDQPVWQAVPRLRAGSSLHGDFGVSLSTQQKVLTEFLTLFPATIELVAVRDAVRDRHRRAGRRDRRGQARQRCSTRG